MTSLASRIHSSVLDKVLQALHVNLSGGHALITTHCTSRSVNIFSNTNSDGVIVITADFHCSENFFIPNYFLES